MQLLVSVRSPGEAEAALSGGADIVDAKEPSRGSLGAVSPDVLAEILDRIPVDRPASIALGDVTAFDDVRARIASLPRSARPMTYLKLGFAGVSEPEQIRRFLEIAQAAAADTACARVVAVAYADAVLARSAPPEIVCRAATMAGIAGVLFDTYQKSGGDLLTWIPLPTLSGLIASARENALVSAVAGGLSSGQLDVVSRARPDIVGFRGAACTGGRAGRLSEHRVRQLRCRLDQVGSAFLQGTIRASSKTLAKRPSPRRISAIQPS
jgi:(5-formylfuran-3-yl)methyl phosphate synthase